MFILKSFSSIQHKDKLKNNIISKTYPLVRSIRRSPGLYSKFTKNTITIVDAENDDSLRGGSFNIIFYGIIIHFFKKNFLFGWIGPSLSYTILTLLTVLTPFEYIEFRIVAIIVWFFVYLANNKRILALNNLVLMSLKD